MSFLPLITVFCVLVTLFALTNSITKWDLFPCSKVLLAAKIEPSPSQTLAKTTQSQCQLTFISVSCHLNLFDAEVSAPQWLLSMLPEPKVPCESELCHEGVLPTIEGQATVDVSSEGMCTLNGSIEAHCPGDKMPVKGKIKGVTPCTDWRREDIKVEPDFGSSTTRYHSND